MSNTKKPFAVLFVILALTIVLCIANILRDHNVYERKMHDLNTIKAQVTSTSDVVECIASEGHGILSTASQSCKALPEDDLSNMKLCESIYGPGTVTDCNSSDAIGSFPNIKVNSIKIVDPKKIHYGDCLRVNPSNGMLEPIHCPKD